MPRSTRRRYATKNNATAENNVRRTRKNPAEQQKSTAEKCYEAKRYASEQRKDTEQGVLRNKKR